MASGKISSRALADGVVIRTPPSCERGYWAGAPGVFYDEAEKTFYLTYRVRRPRGVEPDRGGEARIARSPDGVQFEDIWSVTKDAYSSPSIERCALARGDDGQWRYFAAYVDPSDGRWCVGVIKAPSVESLDPAGIRPLYSAAGLGTEGVKDPWIYRHSDHYCMLLSVALATPETSGESHATQDIYNTGQCLSATGIATSGDLDRWQWQGVVFQPDASGWDRYCRRINSFVFHADRYLGFYDGCASHDENYEEKTGIAESQDLLRWRTLSVAGPALTSPHASRSLRYVDAQIVNGRLHLVYEFARPDGAHDLRAVEVDVDALPARGSAAD